MKRINIFLLSLASSVGAFASDIQVSAGKLADLISGDALKQQTELKLIGTIDARDLSVFETLPADISVIDLSGVKIESLSSPARKYFGRTLFKEGEIPAYTFFKSNAATLILPREVSLICNGAFAGAAITEITIPEGVTAIEDYAFYGCPNLQTVVLPASLKSIGKGAFGNCTALKSVDLSATGITEIPERAFAGSVILEDIKLPAQAVKIGREAFSHTAIKTLDLSGIAEFEPYALSGMPYLSTLIINPDAKTGDGLLMDNISLESLTGMPEYVPDYFAANCGALNSRTASEASALGKYSFANTLSPEELVLTNSIVKIERGAFSGLDRLTKIDVTALEGSIPEVEELSFEGINPPDIELWVDSGSEDDWRADPVWSQFKIVAIDTAGADKVTPDSADSIMIAYRGGYIIVESNATVDDVRIYTPDGRMAYVASPASEQVKIDTTALPSGIVIVTATDRAGNTKNLSLLIK